MSPVRVLGPLAAALRRGPRARPVDGLELAVGKEWDDPKPGSSPPPYKGETAPLPIMVGVFLVFLPHLQAGSGV